MAKEALELIKKAESDAGRLVEDAKVQAEKDVNEAKAQKTQELADLKKQLDSNKNQAKEAARQLAEAQAKTVIEKAQNEAGKLSKRASEIAEAAKDAVLKELIG